MSNPEPLDDLIVLDVRSEADLSKLEGSRNAVAGDHTLVAVTDVGIWMVPTARDGRLLDAGDVIDLANQIIRTAAGTGVAPVLRVVANSDVVDACVTLAVREGAEMFATADDLSHVTTFPAQQGALQVAEVTPALQLCSSSILEFLLPNHAAGMYLTEEMAQAALSADRPEIACLAFAQAFRTNPFFAYQSYFRDQYEMVSLMAGDAEVPMFGVPAQALFADLASTARLPALPEVEAQFEVMVSYPPSKDDQRDTWFPPIEINQGYDIDGVLIQFGGFLVHSQVEDEIAESADVSYFLAGNQAFLQKIWSLTGRLDRMRTERACFNRFGIPLSATKLVDPPVEEALVAFASIRAGIPLSVALGPLDASIDEWENA